MFILESFCHRFSRKFKIASLTLNSRNSGVVVKKDCNIDYTEIMIDAVLSANVPLNNSSVGEFLRDSGYTARSSTTKIEEIIEKIKSILIQRGN